MAREVSKWITVNGNHVPIFKGETKADVRKRIEQLGSKSPSKKSREDQPITHDHYTKTRKKLEKAKDDVAKKDEKWVKDPSDKNRKSLDKSLKKREEAYDKEKKAYDSKKIDSAKFKKGSGPEDVFDAAQMMKKGDGTVKTKNSKIIKAYEANGSYGVVKHPDGSATIMDKKSDAWKKHSEGSSEKETKIDGANTISKNDFVKKYAEEYGMDADDFKQKGKDIKNFIIPEDEENPYIGVEYSDGTYWRYGTGRDLEVSKKELQDSLGKPTQQDKDERIKQKQIATANKQKDALNSEKTATSSFNKYDADKDKYCNQLKKDDVIEFEENGKTYKGRVIDGDGEIHKTLPNGAHKVTNAYTVNKLTEDGKDDYNLAGSHKVKVDPKNIKGYQSKADNEENVFTAAQKIKESGKVTTKNEDVADVYKANGSYAVVKNSDGSYDIMDKGSDAWKSVMDSASKNKDGSWSVADKKGKK